MPLFCSHCGAKNREDVAICEKCDRQIGHSDLGARSSGQSSKTSSGSSRATWIATALICLLYLIYPSLGLFELIPDAVPVIGSLDEAAATTGLLLALVKLGWIAPRSPEQRE